MKTSSQTAHGALIESRENLARQFHILGQGSTWEEILDHCEDNRSRMSILHTYVTRLARELGDQLEQPLPEDTAELCQSFDTLERKCIRQALGRTFSRHEQPVSEHMF